MSTHSKLTPVEREVMKHLCAGRAPKQIAPLIGYTGRQSVHNHITKVKDKLGADTTYQACAIFAAIHKSQPWMRDILAGKKLIHPWKKVMP